MRNETTHLREMEKLRKYTESAWIINRSRGHLLRQKTK